MLAYFFALLSGWMLVRVARAGLPNGGDEWMRLLFALAGPFFAWDFFEKGWRAVLWVKFSDRLRLRRWWGPQTLACEEISAIHPVVQNSYSGVQIEVRHRGSHQIVLHAREYADLQALLAAQGHSDLIQDLPA